MPETSEPASKADLLVLEEFQKLHDYVDERTRDLQTELLRAFADYTA
jgi:hypothetical protein